MADLTGTKTAGFGSSGNLVLLAGSNKIVEGRQQEALNRLMTYALPMESLRAHLAYGVPASATNNIGEFWMLEDAFSCIGTGLALMSGGSLTRTVASNHQRREP